MNRTLFLLPLLLLAACAGTPEGGADYRTYLARKGVTHLEAAGYDHCHGYGCRLIARAALDADDWVEIAALFPPERDAATERAAIARAVGLMEEKTGPQAGTENDKGGTYVQFGDGQHDCVDESVNTTVYLSLLDARGLIPHHSIGVPTARVPPFSLGLGPHQTAVIADRATGVRFAVDSWFHDNGVPAEIVPLRDWFFGWRPGKNVASLEDRI